MKRLSALFGLLACCVMVTACNTTESTVTSDGTLKAKRIVITDDAGKERIVLGQMLTNLGKDAYGAVFFDEDGNRRGAMGTTEDGDAAMVLWDTNGMARVLSVTSVQDGDAGTIYFDDDGVVRVRMGSDETGEAGMELLDGDQEVVRGIRSYRYSSEVTETGKK